MFAENMDVYYIFSLEILSFVHWIKVISSQPVSFTLWKYQKRYFYNVKITSRYDVMSCIACSIKDLIENHWKNPFEVENVSWDRILHLWKYKKSCLTHKINSIFNVKPLIRISSIYHCKYKPLLVCSRKTEYDILHN